VPLPDAASPPAAGCVATVSDSTSSSVIAAVDNLIGSISTNELASGVGVGVVVSALAGKGDDKSVSVGVEEVLDIVVARDVATGVGDGANVDGRLRGAWRKRRCRRWRRLEGPIAAEWRGR